MGLRDYQQPAYDAAIEHFKTAQGTDPAILDMSVGAGKTALAAFIAKHVADKGGRVMVLARIGELVQQNGAFAESIGLKVSYFSSSLGAKHAKHSIIHGTEGTVVRALDSVFKEWRPDILVIDEAHMVDFDNEETMYMRIIRHFQKLNNKLRVLGLTGSPFRGTESIVGPFWKKCLFQISTESLVSQAWLVPVMFGFPEVDGDEFDFSKMEEQYGTLDFTDEQYDAFRNGDPTLTHRIMVEVVHRTIDELGVLVFCQSKKHCLEAAEALPPGSWAIITDETPEGERADALAKANTGELKYILNCAVLGVGVNVPYWMSIVYLRRVSSLVFLIQSIGRGLRLFIESGADLNAMTIEQRKEEIAASRKPFCRVYDYAGVMDRLGHLYESPMLAQAEYEKAKREGSVIYCPRCNAENSDKARRCRGVDSAGVRCDYFWTFSECRKCGAQNDVTARDCRVCGEQMLDPNAKLLNKAYTDTEMVPVEDMQLDKTRNGGVLVRFILEGEKPDHGWPTEYFAPGGSETARRVWYNNFVKVHVRGSKFRSQIYGMKNVDAILKMRAVFSKPTHIAYRINEKGGFVIGRRRFDGGFGGDAEVIGND